VKILLDAFEKAQKHIQYYALDVSLPELERTFSMVDTSSYRYVKLNGLYGTYDDGLAWLAEERKRGPRGYTTCVMSLGSSIGNFVPDDAASFLAGFATVLDPADYMLIGVDACQDLNRVFQAYNDSEGVTENFYRNALCHANRLLGHEAFKQCDWQTDTNVNKRRHQAVYVALRDIKAKDLNFNAGERLPLEVSCKYSTKESDVLWRKSELIPQMSYANKTGDYSSFHLHFRLPMLTQARPSSPLPCSP
jgi:L-histidine Nalpha-methyltransferase / hercynylcysteine S-oxide synthase